jgi:hypothetical protein
MANRKENTPDTVPLKILSHLHLDIVVPVPLGLHPLDVPHFGDPGRIEAPLQITLKYNITHRRIRNERQLC